MLFVFSIGAQIHSVRGDLVTARRQFTELTTNVSPAAITPRSVTLTTRERLDLETARYRSPQDLFNTMTDAVEAVIDNVPVVNALPLPTMNIDAPQQTAAANAAGEKPLQLPQLY